MYLIYKIDEHLCVARREGVEHFTSSLTREDHIDQGRKFLWIEPAPD